MIPVHGNKELILGIDLGTTNSLIALSNGKEAQVFNDGDSPLIPSVVVFDEAGKIQAVGQRAKTLKAIDPKRIIYSVKRLMGYGKKDLEKIAVNLPFDFSESSDEMIRIRAGNYSYSPIDISAEILKRCKFVAENVLGRPIRKAVVTVPAYFNESQRSATAMAGKSAGLEVVRILNEPTAAALAFGLGQTEKSSVIAVYDFGGGTFDISILKVTNGVFEVLSTYGDTQLGGDDLDHSLYHALIQRVGAEPKTDEDRILVLSQIENLKRKLTEEDAVEISLHWAGKIQWSGTIHRSEANEVFKPVIEKTIEACRNALEASGLSRDKIDHLVMVGGSTRVPLVQEMSGKFFGRAPNTSVNPDEVVALGAAIQGAILAGEQKGTLLLDVVPLSLGIETMGGLVSKIIHRNTTLPCSVHEDFTTYVDNQTGVDIHIVQGERELVADCRSLGRFKLRIPPAPAGAVKVRIRFLMDANGMLRVRANDLKTEEEATLEVRPSFGLTDQEVERMLSEAFKYAKRDIAERQLIEAKNQALTLIRATEKSFENPLLDAAFIRTQRAKILPVIQALQKDIEFAAVDIIVLRTRELDHLTQELAEAILNRALRSRLSVG